MSTSPHYKGVKNESTIKKDGDTLKIIPTALDVTWGNDSRYWSIDKNANDRGAISLLQVSWLEVTGTFSKSDFDNVNVGLDYSSTYSLKFRVRMKADAFGWNGCPVYVMVKDAAANKFQWKKVDLSRITAGETAVIPTDVHRFKPPADKLIFGLFEIWRGRWKGGLEILEVIIEKTQ